MCVYIKCHIDPSGFYGSYILIQWEYEGKQLNNIQRLKLSTNVQFDADADIYDQNSDACNVNQLDLYHSKADIHKMISVFTLYIQWYDEI